MKFIFISVLAILISTTTPKAQSIPETLIKDVYGFLGRLSQKGVIKFDDQIRPVSRKYIAEKLLEASSKLNDLTSLEKEELGFYKKDYAFEFAQLSDSSNSKLKIQHSTLFGLDVSGRYRLFSYSNDIFKVNVSPIVGYEAGKNDGSSYSHKWTGL
jgi:hypothetical protein